MKILFFAVLISSFSCNNKVVIMDTELLGCWTHSREEDDQQNNRKIYRKCESRTFPLSRYRHSMDLKVDNKCSWLYLAPNDRHEMKPGKWGIDQSIVTIKIINELQTLSFKIISLEKDKMVLEWIDQVEN